MKEKLIDKKDIQKAIPALQGKTGGKLVEWVIKFCGLHKANELYNSSKMYTGSQFCMSIINNIGIELIVENREILDTIKSKPFITVSNHAYGHIDGLALIGVIGEIRQDYKVMANLILGMIDSIADNFLTVNPYKEDGVVDASTRSSIKNCLSHIEEGHPLGFFPSGSVSDLSIKKRKIEDKKWRRSTVGIIRKSNVPVIPVYFSGKNSNLYHILDWIDWRLGTIRLPREILNKQGKTVCMTFGTPIFPEEINTIRDNLSLAQYLKDKTYALVN